jgi:hypothetical protein
MTKNTIQSRVNKVKILLKQVKKHCMCLKFEEDKTHYRIIHPEGFYPHGVQCSKQFGKAWALTKILKNIENHWQESFKTGQ